MGSDDGTCDRTEVVKLQHPPPPQPPSTSTPFPPPDPSVAKVESRKDPISSAGEQTSEVPGDGNICILTARRKSLNCARGRRVHFGASEATGEADDGDVHIEVIEIPNRFEEDRSPSYCPAVDFYWQHPCELESPANDEFELDDLPGAMIEMPARSYTASTSRVRRPRRRRMAVEESATSTDLQLQRHLQMHSAFVPSRQRRVSQMPADIEYFHKRLLMTAALKPHASRRLSADFDASDVLQVSVLYCRRYWHTPLAPSTASLLTLSAREPNSTFLACGVCVECASSQLSHTLEASSVYTSVCLPPGEEAGGHSAGTRAWNAEGSDWSGVDRRGVSAAAPAGHQTEAQAESSGQESARARAATAGVESPGAFL